MEGEGGGERREEREEEREEEWEKGKKGRRHLSKQSMVACLLPETYKPPKFHRIDLPS